MPQEIKDSVFLPRTEFAMRGNLPQTEPKWLEMWRGMGLYQRLRQQSAGRPTYILHDGPPFANGHIHMGHALNKILKDVVARSHQMLGFDAPYVPGWDCHGLPIEWKIEEEYRAKGKDKDQVPVLDFRAECRAFAQTWKTVQSQDFQRLGVVGDWENPYSTMTFAAEAQILREIHKYLINGSLHRGAKPVMWSVVEKTALADAEVEYHDHVSTTVYVAFPIAKTSTPALEGAQVVIWTTTPWTLPGNRAIAFGPEMTYGVYAAPSGARYVLAESLAEQVSQAIGQTLTKQANILGPDLADTVCHHPLRGQGYEFDVPLLVAGFVTHDTGTGFVHIAPGHGADDFYLGQSHGLSIPETVGDDGVYGPSVPLFAGKRVLTEKGKEGDANAAVIEALTQAGALLAQAKLTHSYPHSWRSKAPIVFRTTPQWFIAMDDTNGLRAKALSAIEATRFVPSQGYNRIKSMVEQRPDWCVSRQRAWGVPLAFFVHKTTGEALRDPAVLGRIQAAFEEQGADAWYANTPESFLGANYNAQDYTQIFDIVDVWFESGSTHSFVLEQRPELTWPADLYLEGSDQHRGWFQSSLLQSCGSRGRAPFQAVLTHGFTLDEQGQKMSKSIGNIVAPQNIIEKYGADILRLWVLSTDYTEDQRIGDAILKQQADVYRRLRNTLRYVLGALDGFTPQENLPFDQMPEAERWVLHRVAEMDASIRQNIHDFAFHAILTDLHSFCAQDLSAFYFDLRKDSLYCDRPDAIKRRAARTVMNILFDYLTAWLAPILCFTAEEAWQVRRAVSPFAAPEESVHLRLFPDVPKAWRDEVLAVRWKDLRDLRRVVTGALELARAEKSIGSSLQAAPVVTVTAQQAALLQGVDFAELAITSDLTLRQGDVPAGAFTLPDVPGCGVVVEKAVGEKCERCWRILPEVAAHPRHVCGRCEDALGSMEGA
ncbi:MAG: isoleucine--tRNA ligase [Alphaproteobacteria bacterium]|nr:MAG: isoleucine--tRNA ligase [Alphaproteobacteria bacterium]